MRILVKNYKYLIGLFLIVVIGTLAWQAWLMRITIPLESKIYENEFVSFSYPSDYVVSNEYKNNGITKVMLKREQGIPLEVEFSIRPHLDNFSLDAEIYKLETETIENMATSLAHM